MAKHKRLEKKVQVETCLGLEYSTLAELKGMVEAWIAMHGEDAWLEQYQEAYGDDSYYWAINKKVPETDAEYDARVALLKRHETAKEERDRAEFERLSKKYGAV
jgi:hypothetical protein